MSRPNPNPDTPTSPSGMKASMLVAEREVIAQVTTKSFIISFAITLTLVLGGILAAWFFSGRESDGTDVAVVPETLAVVEALDGLNPVEAADLDAATALVAAGEVEAAVVPGDGPTGLVVVSKTGTPSGVVMALSVEPEVVELEPATSSEGIRYLVSLAFGLVFMMAAMGSGSVIAQSTVQEKQTRVVEILLSAVSARALLGGKILGNSVVAFGQTAAIAAVAVLGLVLTGQDELLGLLGAPLVWFVVFFIIGFILLAAMFAAGASLVSRVEDTGSVIMPAMMLTMIPYFMVVFFGDNPVVMSVLSYVPFSAPVAMPVRLFFGDALWWEPLISLAILGVSAWVVTAIGARIYSGSLLRTGPRVGIREALAEAS